MILNELITTVSPKSIYQNLNGTEKSVKVTNFIKKHCSEFLAVYQNSGALYHGFKKTKPLSDTFITNSRENRTPKDSAVEYQKLIDEKLKQAGFNALRGNSIFCTHDPFTALKFGKVYLIFPLNGFDFTWSRSYDLTAEYALTYSGYLNAKEMYKEFKEAEQSGDSLYIKQMYLQMSNDDYKMYFDLKRLTPEEFIKKYRFSNKNLEKALASNFEIYIRGQYISVSQELWSTWTDNLFNLN